MISRPHDLLAPLLEATLSISQVFFPQRHPSLVPSAKVHRRGILTACFGCQGKKVQVQKHALFHPHPHVLPSLDPFPRQLWAAAARRKPAEAITQRGRGVGAASQLSTSRPFHIFASFLVGVQQMDTDRHGRSLQVSTLGCLSSAPTRTQQQPVASIVGFRHPS